MYLKDVEENNRIILLSLFVIEDKILQCVAPLDLITSKTLHPILALLFICSLLETNKYRKLAKAAGSAANHKNAMAEDPTCLAYTAYTFTHITFKL